MLYSKGYRYQLEKDELFRVHVYPFTDIDTKFIFLATTGLLCVRDGYAWDGPSGPALDTRSVMRASLCHDALYQLLREELVESFYRREADEQLYQLMLEDGANPIRAWLWQRAVIRFAAAAADPKNNRKIYDTLEGG